MRVVDVCAFYAPRGGGVKNYVQQKLAIGPKLGHEIVIIAPGDCDHVTELGDGARIITISSPRFPLDRKYHFFNDAALLHRTLDKLEPDFVEVSSPWRSPAMIARWSSAVPRSLVMHADPMAAYAYRWLEPVLARETIDRGFAPFWAHLRALSRHFDRVVCANQQLRDRLAAGGVINTVVHPLGIDANRFSPARRDPQLRAQLLDLCKLPESGHLLIGVGRLSPEKRWPMVVEAATSAGRAIPVGLIILGEGNDKTRIQRTIAGNPHIHLLGVHADRDRFAAVLASADALIHGCEAETFCLAAAEARASGIPVIAPDAGGAADHTKHGAGLSYRAGSAVAAADAIWTLFRKPAPYAYRPPRSMREHFVQLFADYSATRTRQRDTA